MTRPVILYDNLFTQGELSSQLVNGDPALAVDWFTYDGIQFQTGLSTISSIAAALGSPSTANALGVAAHNLGSKGATVSVRDGINSGLIIASYQPVDDSPFILEFDDHTTDEWTISVDAGPNDDPFVNIIVLGSAMNLERSAFLNVTPPGFNPSDEYNRNRSETGQTMGLTLKRLGIQNEISFDNVSLQWIKDEWQTFTDHMRKKACFWGWDQDDNPLDVAFVERDGNPQANPTTIGGPNQQGYWQVSLPVKGRAE